MTNEAINFKEMAEDMGTTEPELIEFLRDQCILQPDADLPTPAYEHWFDITIEPPSSS